MTTSADRFTPKQPPKSARQHEEEAARRADDVKHAKQMAALPVLRELFEICGRIPVLTAFPKIPDFSGERERFMRAMIAAEQLLNSK